MTTNDITHLTQAIMGLKSQLERMAERQDEMLEDVKKIKEAVYNPESGLYARIRELEQWKESQAKFQWFVMTSIFGLIITTAYKMILST